MWVCCCDAREIRNACRSNCSYRVRLDRFISPTYLVVFLLSSILSQTVRHVPIKLCMAYLNFAPKVVYLHRYVCVCMYLCATQTNVCNQLPMSAVLGLCVNIYVRMSCPYHVMVLYRLLYNYFPHEGSCIRF